MGYNWCEVHIESFRNLGMIQFAILILFKESYVVNSSPKPIYIYSYFKTLVFIIEQLSCKKLPK